MRKELAEMSKHINHQDVAIIAADLIIQQKLPYSQDFIFNSYCYDYFSDENIEEIKNLKAKNKLLQSN